jgi:hypothetical protein
MPVPYTEISISVPINRRVIGGFAESRNNRVGLSVLMCTKCKSGNGQSGLKVSIEFGAVDKWFVCHLGHQPSNVKAVTGDVGGNSLHSERYRKANLMESPRMECFVIELEVLRAWG